MEKNKDIEVKKCSCGDDCKCKRKSITSFFTRFIIVVFLIVCGVCAGMMIGGHILVGDNKCTTQEIKEDIPSKIEDEEECVYVSDYEKIVQRIEDLSKIEQVSRNINSIEDFTNQDILLFAIDRLGYDENHTLEEVNAVTQDYFGIDVKPEDIDCHHSSDEAPLFVYNSDKKVFEVNAQHGGHGLGSYYSFILNRVVNYEFKDNLYVVEVKKAFGYSTDTGPVTSFYKSYEEMSERVNPIIDVKFSNYEELDYYDPEIEFNNLSNDKMNTYVYTFKKVNDEFVLVSYIFE